MGSPDWDGWRLESARMAVRTHGDHSRPRLRVPPAGRRLVVTENGARDQYLWRRSDIDRCYVYVSSRRLRHLSGAREPARPSGHSYVRRWGPRGQLHDEVDTVGPQRSVM